MDASPSGKAVFEMDIGDKYSNLRGKFGQNLTSCIQAIFKLRRSGTMHGAAAALIFGKTVQERTLSSC